MTKRANDYYIYRCDRGVCGALEATDAYGPPDAPYHCPNYWQDKYVCSGMMQFQGRYADTATPEDDK